MSHALRLLLVEDNPLDAELILRQLARAGYAVDVSRVDTEAGYREFLTPSLDLVICDFELPEFSGLEALRILRERDLDVPFLLVSGAIGERLAVEIMKLGATDFLLKDRLERLGPVVAQALQQAQLRRGRREAEEALRLSEERFRQLTEHLQEVFWIADITRDYVDYVSPAYAHIWARAPEALLQSPGSWIEAVHEADRERVKNAATTCQVTGTFDEEYRIVRPDGAIRWIHDRAFAVRGPRGNIERLVGVADDITRQRLLEDQVRQAQKMEAIGQLAGGVAHDFNNILTVIQMNGAAILADGELSEEVRDGVLEIQLAAQRAAALTRQLLVFGRRETMQPRELDLNVVVSDVAKMLQRMLGEDVALTIRLAPRPLPVTADAGMLEQVLMNLAVNARDAMPRGGELIVETAAVELAPGQHGGHASHGGPYARLEVRDTGSGIPEEIRARIFEPFFTTKPVGKGTGLGLATVYTIVQRHRGWIDVSSPAGSGAVFSLHLPRVVVSGAAAEHEGGAPATAGRGETVLVTEDDATLRRLTARLLGRFGYRVLEASSGRRALELWAEHRGQIALLLTDLIMPAGVSGAELAREMQADDPHLRVVYMSGYSVELTDIASRPDVYFLAKPYEPQKLAQIVRRCLDEASPEANPSGGVAA